MRKLRYSSRFKKDFKKYKRDSLKVEALKTILNLLVEGNEIPKENKPHILKGDYRGFWECHVEDDFLLIWIDGDVVELLRLGSHSELFGKKRR